MWIGLSSGRGEVVVPYARGGIESEAGVSISGVSEEEGVGGGGGSRCREAEGSDELKLSTRRCLSDSRKGKDKGRSDSPPNSLRKTRARRRGLTPSTRRMGNE